MYRFANKKFLRITILSLVLLDQFTKYLAISFLHTKIYSMVVIPDVLNFTFVRNRGAAFGMLQGARWFFIIFTTIILVGIYRYYEKLPDNNQSNWIKASLVLIVSGALGNAIDRGLHGEVVDFIEAIFIKFMQFPVFNFADIYVVVGTMLFSILLMFFIKEDEKGEKL